MRRMIALFVLLMMLIPAVSAAQSTECVGSPQTTIPIAPENIDQFGLIDAIGRGYNFRIVWLGDQIFTESESGWWRTNAALTAEPCRALPPAEVSPPPQSAPDAIRNQIPADERDFTTVLGVSPSRNFWLTLTSIWASDRSHTDVWNADGTLLHTLPDGGFRPYMHAAFNADESQIAIVGADGAITIYDVASGAELNHSDGWGGYAVAMAVSPSGNEVVIGNEEIARIWLLDRNTYSTSLPGTYTAAFMPDGTIALPQDNAIRFYTATDGREARSLFSAFPMYGTEIAVSPNGNWIALVHPENGWSVIDAQTGAPLMSGNVQQFEGMFNMVDIDISDTHLAVAEIDVLYLIPLNAASEIRTLPSAGFPAVAFSPDGSTLATSSATNLIQLYNVNDPSNPRQSGYFGSAVTDIEYSPDGRLIAVGAGDTLQLFDAATGENLYMTEAYFGSMQFTPDGTRIITGDWTCYLCGADESAQLSAAQVWGIVPD